MERERFIGRIWEPAAGDDSMVRVLREYHDDVFASELRMDDGVRCVCKGVDFLSTVPVMGVDNIVTNPPFCVGQKFVEHALKCANRKVAMMLRLSFLETQRRKEMFARTPLRRVYVFAKRVNFDPEKKGSSMLAFAWFVWDKNWWRRGAHPELHWI
jgi:hypothetical protein